MRYKTHKSECCTKLENLLVEGNAEFLGVTFVDGVQLTLCRINRKVAYHV